MINLAGVVRVVLDHTKSGGDDYDGRGEDECIRGEGSQGVVAGPQSRHH